MAMNCCSAVLIIAILEYKFRRDHGARLTEPTVIIYYILLYIIQLYIIIFSRICNFEVLSIDNPEEDRIAIRRQVM